MKKFRQNLRLKVNNRKKTHPTEVKKYLLFILILLVGTLKVTAFEIKGRLVDSETKQPVSYATVNLLKADSTYLTGVETNDGGHFSLHSNADKKDHILKITYLGYKTEHILIKNLTSAVDLGNVEIREDSKLLNEVTVTTSRTQNRIDRQIVLPDAMQVKSSSNAFELLSKMPLARLDVNPVERKLSIGTEDVQIRINGVRATMNDVLALLPKNIKRVEYYDNPGVRFGNENIGAVVDFIVERGNDYGGYFVTNLQNAPFIEFGNDYAAFKLNHKASEFGISYNVSYRGYDKRWSEGTSTYNFPGQSIHRLSTRSNSPMFYIDHGLNLTYNLTKADNYILNVAFNDNIFNGDFVSASNILYTDTNKETHQRSENNPYKTNTPVLDVFYKKHLKNKQTFALNMVGTYIYTKDNRKYSEKEVDNGNIISEFENDVEGKKYSLITEMVYDKEFEKIKLASGLKHTQGHAKNKYRGNNPFDSDMQNTDTYIYSQVNGTIGSKLSYSLGAGMSRLWFKEDNKDIVYYLFRPSLSLAYPLSKNININYNFNVNSRTPSLAALSNVEQQQNTYLINKGNPNLKPYKVYTNRLMLNYNKSIITSSFSVNYAYHRKLFVSTYAYNDTKDKIVSFSDNHKAHHEFNVFANVAIKLIENIWTIKGWMQADRSIFYGNDVTHTYSSLYGGFSTDILYKKFSLSGAFNTRARTLWGENINYNQYWQSIQLGYKHKEAKVTLGMSFPFEKAWSAGSRNVSALAPSNNMSYIKENGQMFYVGFSWNISFGRKHNAGEKSLNNADHDKGIL